MTNNFKESNLYFIKDTTDPTRPLMGDLLIYCETMAAMLANGITDKAEADRLCGLLNNGEIEYEEGREFEVVALPTIEHEDAPADEEESGRGYLPNEAGEEVMPFAQFKAFCEEAGGFNPSYAYEADLKALWEAGKEAVVWCYCDEWAKGETVFTDVEADYPGIENTCEVLSTWLVEMSGHTVRVMYY